MTDQIITEAETFVAKIFEECCNSSFVFHNLQHTHNVVKRCREIAKHYHLQHDEWLALNIAAFFHDTGYLLVQPKEHESKSVEIFLEFQKIFSLPGEIVENVIGCIMATKFPTNPQNFLQEIICDADTYHLGTDVFQESNSQICEELTIRQDMNDSEDFYLKTIALLKKHRYYTFYCQELLEPLKESNLNDLIIRHVAGNQ